MSHATVSEEPTGELFPDDCALLPLFSGQLLVSPGHAIFCHVPPDHVDVVTDIVGGTGDPTDVPEQLRAELLRHGFGGPPRPAKPPSRSVQLQLTNSCNLSCSYCCTNSGQPRSTEVSREQMFAVVDDVREVLGPGTGLALLGGEPLLVPWAVDLAEHVVERELRLTLFTNGTPLVDENIAKRLAPLVQRRAQIRVSLAGATAEQCDRNSGAARFEAAVAGINTLARFGALAVIDLMLLPDQVDDVAEHMHELRKLLPPGIAIALGIPYLSGRELGAHVFGSRAELESALDRIAFEAGETIAATKPGPLADRREGCTCSLGHHLHVRSDGSLFTCFKMEELVGHLNELSFAEALRRLQAGARPAHTLPRCLDCALATLCGGGCRSENLQYTGDPNEPVCGPWRVRVLSELLAEDRCSALEWPALHLLAEAKARRIECPEVLVPSVVSRHLVDT